jgi:hypothetical protein
MVSNSVIEVFNVELHNSFCELSVLRITKNLTEEGGGFGIYFGKE